MSFGDVAVGTVKLINNGLFDNPKDAWINAVKKLFPNSKSMQVKSCPKDAFLGLCEEGLIKGIKKGFYTNSKLNKGYVINAIKILKNEPQIVKHKMKLWSMVAGSKAYNQQMDVVIALWNAELIS